MEDIHNCFRHILIEKMDTEQLEKRLDEIKLKDKDDDSDSESFEINMAPKSILRRVCGLHKVKVLYSITCQSLL